MAHGLIQSLSTYDRCNAFPVVQDISEKYLEKTVPNVSTKHYFANPQILKYVKAFTGKDIRDLTSMFINKPTDPGTLSSRRMLFLYIFLTADYF